MTAAQAVADCKAHLRSILTDGWPGIERDIDALAAALAQEDAALRERHRRLVAAVGRESGSSAEVFDAYHDCCLAGDAAPATPATTPTTLPPEVQRVLDAARQWGREPSSPQRSPGENALARAIAFLPATPPAPPPADPCAGISAPKGAKLLPIDWRHGDGLADGKLLAAWPSRRDWQGFAYPPTAVHPTGYGCGAAVLYRDAAGRYSLVWHDDMTPVRPVGVAVDVTV